MWRGTPKPCWPRLPLTQPQGPAPRSASATAWEREFHCTSPPRLQMISSPRPGSTPVHSSPTRPTHRTATWRRCGGSSISPSLRSIEVLRPSWSTSFARSFGGTGFGESSSDCPGSRTDLQWQTCLFTTMTRLSTTSRGRWTSGAAILHRIVESRIGRIPDSRLWLRGLGTWQRRHLVVNETAAAQSRRSRRDKACGNRKAQHQNERMLEWRRDQGRKEALPREARRIRGRKLAQHWAEQGLERVVAKERREQVADRGQAGQVLRQLSRHAVGRQAGV